MRWLLRLTTILMMVANCTFSLAQRSAAGDGGSASATAEAPSLQVSSGHVQQVTWVGYSPDGSVIASVDFTGHALFWSSVTGQQLSSFNLSPHMLALPDRSPVLFSTAHTALISKGPQILQIDYLNPAKPPKVILRTKGEDFPDLLALSDDGLFLTFQIGSALHVYSSESRVDMIVAQQRGDLFFASFKNNSHELAVADTSNRYTELQLTTSIPNFAFQKAQGDIRSINYDTNSHLLVVTHTNSPTDAGASALLDVTARNTILEVNNDLTMNVIGDSGVVGLCRSGTFELNSIDHAGVGAQYKACPGLVAISPDYKSAALVFANEVVLVRRPISDGKSGTILEAPTGTALEQYQLLLAPIVGVRDLAWLPNSPDLVIFSPASVTYWDLFRSQQVLWTFATSAFAFSADGRWVLTGDRVKDNRGVTKTMLQIVDRTTQKFVDLGIQAERYQSNDVFGWDWDVGKYRLSADGSRFFTVDNTGAFISINTLTKEKDTLCPRIHNVSNPMAKADEQFDTSIGGDALIAACDIADGEKVESAGIYVWNLKTSERKRVTDAQDLLAAALSPDSHFLALAFPHEVDVFDLSTNAVIMKQSLDSAEDYTAVAFNLDNTRLAVGATSVLGGRVEMWDLVSKHQGPYLPTRSSDVTSLLFSSGGSLLVGSNNGTVDIYNRYGDDLLLRVVSVPAAGGLVVDPKTGAFDGTAETMKMVAWRLGSSSELYPLSLFFDDYYTPGLAEQILSTGTHGKYEPFEASVQSRIPGLRIALQQGSASIQRVSGRPALCFVQPPSREVDLDQSLRLLNNGNPVKIQGTAVQQNDPLCNFAIQLDGRLQDYELTDQQSSTSVGTLTIPGSTASHATVHFAAVAISNYPDASGLPILPSTMGDAQTLSDTITSLKNKGVDVHVWDPIFNQDATQLGIRTRLLQMASQVQEQDIVILFLSGHGIVPPGERMFYFAPYDFILEGYKNGLDTPMIADILRSLKARRVLLVIDACQSAGSLDSLSKAVSAKIFADTYEVFQPPSAPAVPPGIEIIAAATPIQLALETNHGVLATALNDGLRNGVLDMRTLADFVKDDVSKQVDEINKRPNPTNHPPFEQTPVAYASGTDFALQAGENAQSAPSDASSDGQK